MRIHSTRCSYYTCKKRASSSDAARSLLRIFVLHSPWRFKRSPEVSRSLRHLIFIRSRKQCRANRCQLRHSGFWLSSQIIAGGNRCLANKLRMNHSWERPFGVHGKIALTCTFECPAWQLSWDQVPFCFFFIVICVSNDVIFWQIWMEFRYQKKINCIKLSMIHPDHYSGKLWIKKVV